MLTGKLIRWNDGKGYGFIHVESENRDIFIHISTLSHMSRRPVVGDVIFFDIETDAHEKCKAVNAKIQGVPRLEPSSEAWALVSKKQNPRQKPELRSAPFKPKQPSHRSIHYERKHSGFFKRILPLLIVAVVVFAYQKILPYKVDYLVESMATPQQVDQAQDQFQCQGKKRCSEMTSCAEATFYITHCPGTEMDGDRDGIPCESQWCN